jgi:hypothetical protein
MAAANLAAENALAGAVADKVSSSSAAVRRRLTTSMTRASGGTTVLKAASWSSLNPPGCLVVQLEALMVPSMNNSGSAI